jgi:hypothetical protein
MSRPCFTVTDVDADDGVAVVGVYLDEDLDRLDRAAGARPQCQPRNHGRLAAVTVHAALVFVGVVGDAPRGHIRRSSRLIAAASSIRACRLGPDGDIVRDAGEKPTPREEEGMAAGGGRSGPTAAHEHG